MSTRAFDRRGRRRAQSALALAGAVVLMAPHGAMAADPPDGRKYELISPVLKFGGYPAFPQGVGTRFSIGAVFAASANGDQFTWYSQNSFGNARNGVPMSYVSTRTDSGWRTDQAFPNPTDPHPNAFLSISQVQDVTDDLSVKIVPSATPLDPQIVPTFFRRDLYSVDRAGTPTWLSRPNTSDPVNFQATLAYEGRDEDADTVLFTSTEPLVPEAATQVAPMLFRRGGGQTDFMGLDDNDVPLTLCGSQLGGSEDGDRRITDSAVSADGSTVFFSTPQPFQFGDASCFEPRRLYAWVNGRTTYISRSQRAIADPMGTQPAYFQGASADGRTAYILTTEALTNDAADGRAGEQLLYAYDVPSGDLRLLTPNAVTSPRVLGGIVTADDGSILVAAREPLAAGTGTSGRDNIYYYRGGAFRFVATVDDASALYGSGSVIGAQVVRLTDDGDTLLLATRTNLTAYDSAGRQEIYLFDLSAGGAPKCVSCRPDGAAAVGDAFLTRDFPSYTNRRTQKQRNLTSDGRVFFDSDDAILPGDDNRVADVYEWNNGQISLVTSGHDSEPSFFADTAGDGNDVFFVTSEALVTQDHDSDPDFYTARIGGGFPPEIDTTPVCNGDQCQAPPTAPPGLPATPTDQTRPDDNSTAPEIVESDVIVPELSRRALRRLAKTGALTFSPTVNKAGTLKAVVRGRIAGKSRTAAKASKKVARAGRVRLTLKLTRTARRTLSRTGRLKLTLTVSFTGAASDKTKLTLVKPKQKKR